MSGIGAIYFFSGLKMTIIMPLSLLFLQSLYEEKLLQYNIGVMKWLWDDDAVKKQLMTQNVATVMVNKLRRLPEGTQDVLKIASCLGAYFSVLY